jgi:peroxiredoxin family protein
MASAAKDDDAHAPAAKLIRAKSERRVKSIACRMTTPALARRNTFANYQL